jgi:hypothetical protein
VVSDRLVVELSSTVVTTVNSLLFEAKATVLAVGKLEFRRRTRIRGNGRLIVRFVEELCCATVTGLYLLLELRWGEVSLDTKLRLNAHGCGVSVENRSMFAVVNSLFSSRSILERLRCCENGRAARRTFGDLIGRTVGTSSIVTAPVLPTTKVSITTIMAVATVASASAGCMILSSKVTAPGGASSGSVRTATSARVRVIVPTTLVRIKRASDLLSL